MSDIPMDYAEERRRVEHEIAEIQKLNAETRKLLSESRKFNRDPWFVLIGATVAAIAARLPEILRAFGLAQ